MDEPTLDQELSRQANRVAVLMREGCHPAKLELEVAALIAWFDLWRDRKGLPDSDVWRDGSPLTGLRG